MRIALDIHNREQKLNNFLKKFQKSKDMNKKNLDNYYNFLSASGLSPARIHKELTILLKISKWLKKDFKKANKDDIMRLIQIVEKQDYAEWTKIDYKVITKKFYSWLRGFERKEYPPEVKWIKTTMRNKNHKLPEELLEKSEIDKLVECAEHPRDKAFIRILAESGCRISEVASLKIKDVAFDDLGCHIIVSGKTGDRRILLLESTKLLSEWIGIHPFKDNPESLLWIGLGTKNKNKSLSYPACTKIIKSSMKKSGIKKRIYPHLFRHSRATELASEITEFQLKKFMGWSMASEMPAVYVSMSGRDVDNAILRASGMEPKENKEKRELKFKTCPRCKEKNDVAKTFCGRCGSPLDVQTLLKMDDEKNKRLIEAEKKLSEDLKYMKSIYEKNKIIEEQMKLSEKLRPVLVAIDNAIAANPKFKKEIRKYIPKNAGFKFVDEK